MLTQIIVSTSEFLQSYGLYLAGAIALGAFFSREWLASEAGRRRYEYWLLRWPFIGPLAANFAMARFCRMLGTLLGAGVPLIQGLQVARRSIGNQVLTDAVAQSVERVKKGESLAKGLSECRILFAGSVLEMISVAEESGRMDEELVRLASTTENELDQQLKTTVSLMEPVMLFVIAALIGIIFIGMVIPIFTIQDYIQ